MRRCRRQWTSILALILAVCASPGALAQNTSIAGSTVLVAVASLNEDAETVRRVVLASTEIYLAQQGIVAVRSDARPQREELSESLAREARSAGADLVVQGILELSGNEVRVDLQLYLVEGTQRLSRAVSTEPVGLTLDRAIAGMTGSIIEQARPYLVAAAEAATAGTDGPVGGRRADVGNDTGRESAGTESAPGDAPRDRRFALEVSYVPFFPIDPSEDYIASTVSGASMVLLSMPFASDIVGLGIAVRGLLAEATGAATNAILELFPLGLAVRISGIPSPIAPYLRLTGGVALLRATNGVLGSFTTIVPHAGGELGMRMEFLGGYAGLQVFVGFDVVMESSLLILGFSPGIGLAVGI